MNCHIICSKYPPLVDTYACSCLWGSVKRPHSTIRSCHVYKTKRHVYNSQPSLGHLHWGTTRQLPPRSLARSKKLHAQSIFRDSIFIRLWERFSF